MSDEIKISEKARQLLAEEYARGGREGPYPSYAQLAIDGVGDFTLCSLRAIQRALGETVTGSSLAQPSDGALTNEGPEPVLGWFGGGKLWALEADAREYASHKKDDREVFPVARHPSKVCTCPSGDGSLRWPCLVHPPEVKVVLDEK